MEIDVRSNQTTDTIDTIRFADVMQDAVIPTRLELSGDYKEVWLRDTVDEMYILNKEHAQHLIAALNKAIELGWLK